MTRVIPGDWVFSYKGQKIVALWVVRSRGYSASKPKEFGGVGDNWSEEGWRVDMDYNLLHNKIQPAQNMDDGGLTYASRPSANTVCLVFALLYFHARRLPTTFPKKRNKNNPPTMSRRTEILLVLCPQKFSNYLKYGGCAA